MDEAVSNPEGGKITNAFEKTQAKIQDDELSIAFVKYTESSTIPNVHADYLAEPIAHYSDFVTVPIFKELVSAINSDKTDLTDPAYQSLKESIRRFLSATEEKSFDRPIMGLIPRLGWKYINDLLQVYEEYNVRAFAFDFNRKKITTGTQIAMIRPLMEHIANRSIEEHVMFYALNPSPGVSIQSMESRPAADIASLGLGFDIVGGRHVTPPMPSEAFEDAEASKTGEDGLPDFRIFDKEEWVYRDIPLEDVPSEMPVDSGIAPERIVTRMQRAPQNEKYRLQKLVNDEQRALATNELENQLTSDKGFDYVKSKLGVTDRVEQHYGEVRSAFEAGQEQTDLDEFA